MARKRHPGNKKYEYADFAVLGGFFSRERQQYAALRNGHCKRGATEYFIKVPVWVDPEGRARFTMKFEGNLYRHVNGLTIGAGKGIHGNEYLGGKPTGCPHCKTNNKTTRAHLIQCLQVHHQLAVPTNIKDPISWLLNQLPASKPKSRERRQYWIKQWPTFCMIMAQMDNIQHNTIQQYGDAQQPYGQSFIQWLQKDTSTGDQLRSQPSAAS